MKIKKKTVKQKIKQAQDIEGETQTVVAHLKEKLRDNNLPSERREKIKRTIREAERLNREATEQCTSGAGDGNSRQEAS